MSNGKDQMVNVIAKLIELTQKNKIKWESKPTIEVSKNFPNYKISCVFVTEYKNKILRLYRFKYEKKSDPIISALGMGLKTIWVDEITLEIIDDLGNSLWKFPRINALSDLIASVKYQLAGVKELIDDLLKE